MESPNSKWLIFSGYDGTFGSIINKDIALILEEPFMEADAKIKILWMNFN